MAAKRFTRSTEIQSVAFSKEKWTRDKAKNWAKKHDFKYGSVDQTSNYWRLRQSSPDDYVKTSFRWGSDDPETMEKFPDGITPVFAMPKKTRENPYDQEYDDEEFEEIIEPQDYPWTVEHTGDPEAGEQNTAHIYAPDEETAVAIQEYVQSIQGTMVERDGTFLYAVIDDPEEAESELQEMGFNTLEG